MANGFNERMIEPVHIAYVSGPLFLIGLAVVLSRRSAIMMLMGIELMLNAANLNLVAFSNQNPEVSGQIFALFVMVVAAAEVAVGLAILLAVYKGYKSTDPEKLNRLKG